MMKPKTADKLATGIIIAFAVFIIAILVGLIGYIILRGVSISAGTSLPAGRKIFGAEAELGRSSLTPCSCLS